MATLKRSFPTKTAKAGTKPVRQAGKAVELEITLKYITPRIRRLFVVPGDINLHKLHAVIQRVMGWTNSHLHAFHAGSHEYVQPDPNDPSWKETMSDAIIHDEQKHTLGDLIAAKGDKFSYTYDFGDDWEHEIKVKSILASPEPLKFAFCVLGKRACPPEDCGSVPGYEELCEALPDRKHPQHKHWKEWIGDYDPEAFDLEGVNQLLAKIRV